MRHEDAFIYPRVRALVKQFGSIADAARELNRVVGATTADSYRMRMVRTIRGELVVRRPLQWELPWPYDCFHDRPTTEREFLEVSRNARALVQTDGLKHQRPKDAFQPPDGMHHDTMLNDATGQQLGEEVPSTILEPFSNKEVPSSVDELLLGFERAQAEKHLHERAQIRAHVDFRHWQVPVCIMGMSDVHWGSQDVDYAAIRRHVNLLKAIPNLFAFGLGDFNEFAKLKHRTAIEGQIHSPTVQARATRAVFVETWEKWLAVVLGNHDMRVYLESGFDIGEYLFGEVPFGKARIPFLRDGGLVTTEVGSCVYTHNIFHGDSSFGTRFNENHKGRQTARLVDGVTDVQWNGHTHNPAIQDASMPSDDMACPRDAAYVQLGSYKVKGDDHARRRKYLEVQDVQMGAVILFPDAKRVLPFKRVEDAVVVLEGLTDLYERGGSIAEHWPAA